MNAYLTSLTESPIKSNYVSQMLSMYTIEELEDAGFAEKIKPFVDNVMSMIVAYESGNIVPEMSD